MRKCLKNNHSISEGCVDLLQNSVTIRLMQDILTGLNPPQTEAVKHTEGPILVLAGAGTGKTRVLTTRLSYILMEGKAFPNEILAVTFTNKAAREMVERVESLIGQTSAGLWLGTFHALGARLLRTHAEAAGLDKYFTIIDTDDQKRVVTEIVKAMGSRFDAERFPPRTIINIISRWKDNAWMPDEVPADEDPAGGQIIAIYRDYQNKLKALNAADFGDLLLKCLVMFKKHPDILKKYQEQFKYVLVDEYQDTNAVQYLWLRLLVMGHKNICVVGDDDQSIYAWRGAQVGNILKFNKDFPGTHTVRLEQNYRSTGNILKAASGLIANNADRHEKTLWTEDEDGAPIEVHPLQDGREEARFITDRIEGAVGKGKQYQDHAILVRTSAQTRQVEESFMKNSVPYQLIGLLKFYERKEIRDALAYLRLITTDKDDLAFERIVNVPRRGVGQKTMQEIQDIARARSMSLLEATRIYTKGEDGLFGDSKPKKAGKLEAFVDVISHWRGLLGEKQPDELLELVLEESGYMEMLRDDKNKEEARGRMENLKELVRAMQEFADISSFMEKAALATDGDENVSESVKVMTIHGAKGLEFDYVFIPGFEEGLFPHQRSLNEEGAKGVEEERRLAYVAITRAKKELCISYVTSRFMYGTFEACIASRFLQEMPQEPLKFITPTQTGSARFRPSPGSTYERKWQGGSTAKKRMPMLEVEECTHVSDDPMGVGQRVFHQKFGYGRVRSAEGEGAQQRLVIDFEKAGQKKLVAQLANLQPA